ncbi:receptor ligand binding region family protein [Collimonas arenae]|nr:receptor ligand binding region family protein [Collimonas arenae]
MAHSVRHDVFAAVPSLILNSLQTLRKAAQLIGRYMTVHLGSANIGRILALAFNVINLPNRMIGPRMRLHKILVLSSLLLTATLSQAESGVTATTITLGQSAAFSGPARELGKGMYDGAQAYFDQVNASGGVFGRKIVLKTLDDGYEPVRAAANTKQFIEQDDVLALFGYVGTPTSNASIPAISKAKIPFFAPFTGAQSLREPFNRSIFNIRASYFAETEKIVQQITTLKLNRIAVFYQNDAYGKAGLEGVTRALKKRNIEVVGLGTVERNSVDVADAVAKIRQSKPQTVIVVSAYNSSAAFIKAMIAAGSRRRSGTSPSSVASNWLTRWARMPAGCRSPK